MTPSRLAFVPPRYGAEFVGGAEAVVREAALGLAARGWDVDVFTTCARDHYTWRNEYPAGVSHDDGLVTVHRFPVVQPLTHVERFRFEARIAAGERLAADEQRSWINRVYRVPDLFHHLVGHAHEYGAIVFAPYLSWTAAVASVIAPERTIVMPCLHNEPFAQLDIFKDELAGAAGLWFLSEPEHAVAHRLTTIPRHWVTGAGVPVPDVAGYDTARFRARYGIDGPFVLYAGRREGGKGWHTLVEQVARLAARGAMPLPLVSLGAGTVHLPPELDGVVIDLGFVDDDVRNAAFAAAAAYVQPSPNESFSRTTMEAWLAGTPVVAAQSSTVVAWHCERSGGGLVYADEFELAECLALVVESPATAGELASAGREYVLDRYTWPVVLDAMEQSLEEFAA